MHLNSSVNPGPVEFGKGADTTAVSEGRLSVNRVHGVYACHRCLVVGLFVKLIRASDE